MRVPALAVLAALALTGCYFGSRVENLEPARGPRGATVRLFSGREGTVRGELLTVSDTALMVRKVDGTLLLALYRSLSGFAVNHLGDEYLFMANRQRTPDQALLARWRLVARYPQGLQPDQLAQLLQVARQEALVIR